MEENLESIEGYVDHIIYRNADNGYTVLVLVCNEEEETCVGYFRILPREKTLRQREVIQNIRLTADSFR